MDWDFSGDHKASLNQEEIKIFLSAIIEGKYSWACVIVLRAIGLNPKDYLPCRTYNRLVLKEVTEKQAEQDSGPLAGPAPYRPGNQVSQNGHKSIQRIADLPRRDIDLQPDEAIQGSGISPNYEMAIIYSGRCRQEFLNIALAR
jgi:hypothetical protein